MKKKQHSLFINELNWIVFVWMAGTGIDSINAQNMNIGPAVMCYPYSDATSFYQTTIQRTILSYWASQCSTFVAHKGYGTNEAVTSAHAHPGGNFQGYRIDWADGETEINFGRIDAILIGQTLTHTYIRTGTFIPTIKIYFLDTINRYTTTFNSTFHREDTISRAVGVVHRDSILISHFLPSKTIAPDRIQTITTTPSRLNSAVHLHGRLWFDGSLTPLKFDSTRIRFFLDCNNLRDQYLGDPIKPFFFWDSVHSTDRSNNWTNWNQLSQRTGKFYNKNYPFSCPYVGAIYKDGQGSNLLGIVHLEQCSTTIYDPPTNRIYSIGIAYSTNNGNNWTYCGDIIRPQAQKIDGTPNPLNRYNIGGGAYIIKKDSIKGDSLYVYYADYAAMTPPDIDKIGRLCFAKAQLSQVLDNARKGKVCEWVKYNNDSSSVQQGLTGLGSDILPKVSLDPSSKAVYCKSINRYLMLMGQWFDGDSGSSLRMYSSNDGINWSKFWKIDRSSVPHNTAVTIGGYASFCAAPNDPDAADDFHEIGKVFYVNYPKAPNPTTQYSWGNLYCKKIIASPDSSPSQEVPRALQ